MLLFLIAAGAGVEPAFRFRKIQDTKDTPKEKVST